MKNFKYLIILFIIFSSIHSTANESKYPIKSYHQKILLECWHCHGDGDKENYEDVEEDICIACHKSKDYLSDRLKFMDKDDTNPHNSIHDGKSLECYECHSSHKKSVNLCAQCHNIKFWMKEME